MIYYEIGYLLDFSNMLDKWLLDGDIWMRRKGLMFGVCGK